MTKHGLLKAPRNRLLSLVAIVAIAGIPAAVLRGLCVGHSCDELESAVSEVPFCSLPAAIREPFAAGFEGELHRSPDILGVTRASIVSGGTAFEGSQPAPAWPTLEPMSTRVPLAFAGTGVSSSARVPDGTGLDDVAPTLAEMIDFRRPNPQVRSGKAIAGVASGEIPRLIIEVVMKHVGSSDLEAQPNSWPTLRSLMDEGAGTLDATTGAIPLDPAASLTTIGTGGLPNQHGITGTLVRDNEGRIVKAWGPKTPVHIIATLPDDLDEKLGQEPMIGLVRSDVADTGLIGGNWYVDVDKDEAITAPEEPIKAFRRLLAKGFGADDVPDVLGVVLDGEIEEMDAELAEIQTLAIASITGDGSVALVATATGSTVDPGEADMDGTAIARLIERAVPGPAPVVAAVGPGGIFLNEKTLIDEEITEDDVLKPFGDLTGPDGRPLMADTFTAIAVSFERYC
jgi:hypothetical protein